MNFSHESHVTTTQIDPSQPEMSPFQLPFLAPAEYEHLSPWVSPSFLLPYSEESWNIRVGREALRVF